MRKAIRCRCWATTIRCGTGFGNYKEICVGVTSEDELLAICKAAKEKGLRCALVQDSGLTEFAGVATHTAMANGPASDEAIDAITGALALL